MELREEKIQLMEMVEKEGPNMSMQSQELNSNILKVEELKGQIEYLEEENGRLRDLKKLKFEDKERIMRLERKISELEENLQHAKEENQKVHQAFEDYRGRAVDTENGNNIMVDQVREQLLEANKKNSKLQFDVELLKKKAERDEITLEGKQDEIKYLQEEIEGYKVALQKE